MYIESLRVRNFKALQDVTLTNLPRLCVVVGANGTGKSTLFDVFAFLRDCFVGNVRQALIDRHGGATAIGKKASKGPLYGCSADVWAALGVAVYWTDARLKAAPLNGGAV